MATDTTAPRSRRALLAAAAGGATALAASAALPLTAAAADPNDVVKGVDNATTTATAVNNTGTGVGFEGSSTTAAGVYGWSVGEPEGFDAAETLNTGVFGHTPSTGLDNLFGTGVWGDSEDIGVYGSGSIGVAGVGGIGVEGDAFGPGGIGVRAWTNSTNQIALDVVGKVRFDRSGRSTIGKGKSSIKVTLAGVSSSSRVFAMLHSNRSGRWVRAIVPTSGSFTIYLNTTVTSSTYVAWFVLN